MLRRFGIIETEIINLRIEVRFWRKQNTTQNNNQIDYTAHKLNKLCRFEVLFCYISVAFTLSLNMQEYNDRIIVSPVWLSGAVWHVRCCCAIQPPKQTDEPHCQHVISFDMLSDSFTAGKHFPFKLSPVLVTTRRCRRFVFLSWKQ